MDAIHGTGTPVTLDLDSLDTPAAHETGTEIELLFNDNPTGWFVKVRGELSPTVRKFNLAIGNAQRLRNWKERRKGGSANPDPITEEDLQLGLSAAAARIADWRGISKGKQPFAYSEANALELVKRHPPFADQILEASADLGKFSGKQSTN